MNPGEVALQADAVTVSVGGKQILSGASISVRSGEVFALIGPNGAGKSTLLATITGDQKFDSGQITIGGRELADWSLGELSRRRAVLPQDHGVFFPFTVGQVVEMGRAPWRRRPEETDDDEAITEALREVDLSDFAPRPLPSLSGGERARAQLARVLAQRTGVLLLDEPTAALDLRHQEDVMRVAAHRAARGDAVVVVLHDLNLAAAYAHRIALLSEGRIVASGAPADVLTAERIRDVYRQPVEIIRHPSTGTPVILPVRDTVATSTSLGKAVS